MGTELRINTAGWSRELVNAAKNALRGLDPDENHFVYETATSASGVEMNLEELQEIYEEYLPETAEELGVTGQGYDFMPWDELNNRDLSDLADLMNCQTDPDPQLPSLQPDGCGSEEDFIRVYGRWMTKPAQ